MRLDDKIISIYRDVALEFDRDRGRSLMERPYLDAVLQRVPASASVLDLGCGGGEPIARYLIEYGCRVTGVDTSRELLTLCRERFPNETWVEHDMRSLALHQTFDAIAAWDSFFHLNADDQRAMFSVFDHHASAGTMLLFTSGPEAGEAIGKMYGHDLYHASLSEHEYRALLTSHGFIVLTYTREDEACGGHTVWLAVKSDAVGV
jgi:SAM-dependent methyltransferase